MDLYTVTKVAPTIDGVPTTSSSRVRSRILWPDPVPRAQMRGEAAGDAEADHAAIALPDGALGDRLHG
jgi:hypothetical protein